MTRKDYRTVAACFEHALSWARSQDDETRVAAMVLQTRVLADALALEFALDNPRFDRERFMSACGLKEFTG